MENIEILCFFLHCRTFLYFLLIIFVNYLVDSFFFCKFASLTRKVNNTNNLNIFFYEDSTKRN